jgi:mono/diheme cytochrome c family protein
MWKKILLIFVGLIVGVPAAGVGYLYLRKPAQVSPLSIRVPMTPERIARGKYLFTSVADCDGCHSQRDLSRFGGPVVESGRGRGNVLSTVETDLPGTVVAPNLTPDPETGLGAWTDGEKIRAIRDGVDRDGRALFPMMPYGVYRTMSDEDVQAVVAYLNSLPAIKNPLPKTQLNFPVSVLIKSAPKPAGTVPAPDLHDRLKRGEYLATIAGCSDCHTPSEKGQPVAGLEFAGGQKFEFTLGTVYSANITPDPETGIGKWSEEYFLKKVYDYKEYEAGAAPQLSGPQSFTIMPWLSFSRIPPEDLGAIYQYLRTVKPVHHSVETHPGASKKTGT